MVETKENNFEIYFARDYSFVREVHGRAIIIYPSINSWNDFGHRTQFNFVVSDNKPISFTGEIRLAFLEHEEKPIEIINVILNKEKKDGASIKKFPEFFTMQSEMKSYREFVAYFEKETLPVLTQLNDLVALKLKKPLPAWYEKAIKTDAFSYSFIRNSESFFVYHNAGPIIYGLDNEEIGIISDQINLHFKLPAFSNEHRLELNFDRTGLLPKNIAVLIGRNGVGKSQALNRLVRYALKGNKKNLNSKGQRLLINRIIAIGTLGETHRTFPKERRQGKILYKRLSLGRQSRGTYFTGIGDLIIQLLRSPEHINKQKRWNIFLRSIQTIFDTDEIALPVDVNWQTENEDHDFITLDSLDRRGEQSRLEACKKIDQALDPVRLVNSKPLPLSSGELAFINFAAQACLHIENGSLVLLDEPETHLHPNLISDLVGLLNNLLDATGSIAVIATHSAYFVREMPRSQVHVFKKDDDGVIEILTPRLKTIGAEVGAISHFIFGDETAGRIIGLIQEKLANELSNKNMKGSVREKLESLKDELPSEAIMQIARELGIKA